MMAYSGVLSILCQRGVSEERQQLRQILLSNTEARCLQVAHGLMGKPKASLFPGKGGGGQIESGRLAKILTPPPLPGWSVGAKVL